MVLKKKPQFLVGFRGGPENTPILRSVGPKDILLSKDWAARGAIQRAGAGILATVFLLASVVLLIASLAVRAQTSEKIGGVFGLISGMLLALLGCFLAGISMFLSMQLLRGVVRSFYK
jgi:hypothetical protein